MIIRVSSDGKVQPEGAATFHHSIGAIKVYICNGCREYIVVPPPQAVQHLCARSGEPDGC